jgi:hypothetical protein
MLCAALQSHDTQNRRKCPGKLFIAAIVGNPDGAHMFLRTRNAEIEGTRPDRIVIGSGLTEVLNCDKRLSALAEGYQERGNQ